MKPWGTLAWVVAVVVVLAAALLIAMVSHEIPSALIEAIEDNDVIASDKLIKQGLGHEVCRDHGDKSRWYLPIHAAAYNGRPEILNQLILAGESPDAKDSQGRTPLMHVWDGCDMDRPSDYEDCVDVLVGAKADVEARDVHGNTVLNRSPYPAFMVEAILSHGADPNTQNNRGDTPLHESCTAVRLAPFYGSSCDGIPNLLIAGADLSVVNNDGLTAEQLALREKRDDIVRVIKRFENLKRGQATLTPH